MGRAPCCEKIGLRRGRWTAEEDKKLSNYIQEHGEGSWRSLPKNAGLLRCGKSCRLRWINYLRSDVKRGNISPEEEDTIIKLQASLGNKWSLIASHLSGRTDNEIKNYWNSHLRRRVSPATTPYSKRRTSAAKVKKPRKKSATPPPENQSNMNKENEGVLMESTNEVLNSLNSVSSSMDDSNQLVNDEVEWQWEWDIDGGDNMLGLGFGGDNMLGLGFGGEEDDDIIMSWPWESLTHDDDDDDLGVDVNKQDEIIAWLLS